MPFPKIKKKVTSFLLEEEGKISKQSIVTMGTILAGIGIASIAAEDAAGSHLCTTSTTGGTTDNGTTATTGTTGTTSCGCLGCNGSDQL